MKLIIIWGSLTTATWVYVPIYIMKSGCAYDLPKISVRISFGIWQPASMTNLQCTILWNGYLFNASKNLRNKACCVVCYTPRAATFQNLNRCVYESIGSCVCVGVCGSRTGSHSVTAPGNLAFGQCLNICDAAFVPRQSKRWTPFCIQKSTVKFY